MANSRHFALFGFAVDIEVRRSKIKGRGRLPQQAAWPKDKSSLIQILP